MTELEGIRAFWEWWQSARHRLLDGIEVQRHFAPELIQDISEHVAAIGDLDWELGQGTTSRHAFFLSGKGDPELRIVTERWRRMAPAPDAEWSYFPARQARPATLELEFAGAVLKADDLRATFEVDETHRRIHGRYWHPAFTGMEDRASGTALFLLLDGVLGEDGVERWLGVIEDSPAPLADSVPLSDVLRAIGTLSELPADQGFIVLKGTTASGEPLFVTVNAAIKRVDHLLATHHLAVEIPLVDTNAEGMPTGEEATRLNSLEDALVPTLGDAVYFGRETAPGRRTLHWFVAENAAAIAAATQWASAHGAQARVTRDARWDLARRFGAG
jgi:hypothetical protein